MRDSYFVWGARPQVDSINELQSTAWAADGRILGHLFASLYWNVDGARRLRQTTLEKMLASAFWVGCILEYFTRVLGIELTGFPVDRIPFLADEFLDYHSFRYFQDGDSREQVHEAERRLLNILTKIKKIAPVLSLPDAPSRQYSVLEDVLLPYGHEEDVDAEDNDSVDDDYVPPSYTDFEEPDLKPLNEKLRLWDEENEPALVPRPRSSIVVSAYKFLEHFNALFHRVSSRSIPWEEFKLELKPGGWNKWDSASAELKVAIEDVVDDLAAWRKLQARVYRGEEWQRAFNESGLLLALTEFCHAGNLAEFQGENILLPSFRKFNWKLSYLLLLDRWLPPPPPVVIAEGKLFDPAKGNPNFTQELLQFISDNREMHPYSFNPMAAFSFYSAAAFRVNWLRWMKPHLLTLNRASGKFLSPELWNPKNVYDHIIHTLRVPRPERQSELPLNPTQSLKPATFLDSLDPRLRTILMESIWQRDLIERVRKSFLDKTPRSPVISKTVAAPTAALTMTSSTSQMDVGQKRERSDSAATASLSQPANKRSKNKNKNRGQLLKQEMKEEGWKLSQSIEMDENCAPEDAPSWWRDTSCNKCHHLPPEQHCGLLVEVQRKTDAAKYKDYAVTHAEGGNRVSPKMLKTRNKKSNAKRPARQKYVSPEQLGLKYYDQRPGIHEHCGRDIVRFYCREGGKRRLVGGVSFKAFSDEILKILQDNHRLVKVRGIRRREALARWSHIGSMTGLGTHQPSGGFKGSIYNPYACHSGETPEDLLALLRQALSLDLLVEGTRPIFSGAATQYVELCEGAELAHFGRYGLTSYACSNFVSCVHCDRDVEGHCLHPCFQLLKEKCGPNDFNFAYVQWGVAIRTSTNTLWLFDGCDWHSTIMPSAQAINDGAVSEGKHGTNNKRNVNRARTCRSARDNYIARTQAQGV